MIDVCYLASTAAHPDCWILTKLIEDEKLTKNCCGFISFALKIHRIVQEESEYKRANAENTYQSSMEYIYCTKGKDSKITKTMLSEKSLLEVKKKKNPTSSLLGIPDRQKNARKLALDLPNLPIAVSLVYNQNFGIYEEAYEHALQINSSNINSIFPDACEVIFPNNFIKKSQHQIKQKKTQIKKHNKKKKIKTTNTRSKQEKKNKQTK